MRSTVSFDVPVKRVQPTSPPPKLVAGGEIPEGWTEVIRYDYVEADNKSEILYVTSDEQFVLVSQAGDDESGRTAKAITNAEAARWYALTIMPAQLRPLFNVAE